MIRALKVVMIIYGVVLVLAGLLDIFMPDLVKGMYGFGEGALYVKWMAAMIGVLFISIGVWVIVAGRDPLRNIYMVKLAITKAVLAVVITAYSASVGYVAFSQIGGVIILDAIFAVALLVCYPWRAPRSSE